MHPFVCRWWTWAQHCLWGSLGPCSLPVFRRVSDGLSLQVGKVIHVRIACISEELRVPCTIFLSISILRFITRDQVDRASLSWVEVEAVTHPRSWDLVKRWESSSPDLDSEFAHMYLNEWFVRGLWQSSLKEFSVWDNLLGYEKHS